MGRLGSFPHAAHVGLFCQLCPVGLVGPGKCGNAEGHMPCKAWLRGTFASAATIICAAVPAAAQSPPVDAVAALAPTGKLRVGVLMVWYFAIEDQATGKLAGVIPD